MSEPEQPANPPLTRKQMREIRNTGSTPIITPDDEETVATPDEPVVEAESSDEPEQDSQDDISVEAPPAAAVVAPLARPADPVVVPPAPDADSSVDLGAPPLTRRQARQQERIRTASVPVITPEVAAAHAASTATLAPPQPLTQTEPVGVSTGMHDLFGLPTSPAPVVTAEAELIDEEPAELEAASAESEESLWTHPRPADEKADAELEAEDEETPKERVVSPLFGSGLLAGEPEQADLPPSFDQLLSRGTGSVSMPNALILSQAPEVAPIAPLSATGEVLITGTLNLPEGLGSTGHALGTADGKEVDAALVDGELPAHSSPTPIAASAAISTVKTAGDVIRPPAPEKGSRLMLTLAITAGALALALVGVLILAFVTGAL